MGIFSQNLYTYVENNNLDMVNYLLEQGVDKLAINDEGKTALDIAKENQYMDIAELLE